MNAAVDQFGSVRYPFKTININTCGEENLLTIDGMSLGEAKKIIMYRDQSGYFKSTEEFDHISDIHPVTLKLLKDSLLGSSEWSVEKVEKLCSSMEFLDFDMMRLLIYNIRHLALRVLLQFGIYFILCLLFIDKNHKLSVKIAIAYFMKFVLYTLIGLAAILVLICTKTGLHPILPFCIIVILLEAIKLMVIRKDRMRFIRCISSTLILTPMIIYSLI
jgi:hypothetical protein